MSLYEQYQKEKSSGVAMPPDLSGATKIGSLYQQYQQEKNAVPVVPTPQPNLLQKFSSQVKEMAHSSFQQAVEGVDKIISGGTPTQGLEAGLQVGAGVAGVVFSPLAPIINLVNKGIEFAGTKLADTPLMQEYAKGATETDVRTLTALQNLGGIAMGILGASGGKSKTSSAEIAKLAEEPKIVEAVQRVIESKKPTSPQSLYAEYLKSQGYEDYIPESQLPIIDYGKAKPIEPVIQTEALASLNLPKGTRLVPETQPVISPEIKPTVSTETIPTPVPESPIVASEKTPIIETPKPVPLQPGISKIGKDIEAKAVEARITHGFRETAQYDPTTVAEQARLSSEVINGGIDNARAIVRGEVPLPERINPAYFGKAVEEYLSKNPSADVAYELANSHLVSETSVAAQTLRFAAERDQSSASTQLAELKKSRIEKVARTTKVTESDVVRTLKKETESMNLNKAELSWNRFIDEIVC